MDSSKQTKVQSANPLSRQPAVRGVAGGIRIFAQDLDATCHARITRTEFVSNSLVSACTAGLCLAGALATSIQTDIEGCRFDNNLCPRNSGGIYADATLALKDSVLTDNTARSALRLLLYHELLVPVVPGQKAEQSYCCRTAKCSLGQPMWDRSQPPTLR